MRTLYLHTFTNTFRHPSKYVILWSYDITQIHIKMRFSILTVIMNRLMLDHYWKPGSTVWPFRPIMGHLSSEHHNPARVRARDRRLWFRIMRVGADGCEFKFHRDYQFIQVCLFPTSLKPVFRVSDQLSRNP